jgi:hypothetical protein
VTVVQGSDDGTTHLNLLTSSIKSNKINTPSFINFITFQYFRPRAQWPRGIRRGSAAFRLLGLRDLIPPGHGCLSLVSVVLSRRGLCVGPITRPQESYQVWRV